MAKNDLKEYQRSSSQTNFRKLEEALAYLSDNGYTYQRHHVLLGYDPAFDNPKLTEALLMASNAAYIIYDQNRKVVGEVFDVPQLNKKNRFKIYHFDEKKDKADI